MERLSEELKSAEVASARMSQDIEALSRTQAEGEKPQFFLVFTRDLVYLNLAG